jgi:hypothetical protein
MRGDQASELLGCSEDGVGGSGLVLASSVAGKRSNSQKQQGLRPAGACMSGGWRGVRDSEGWRRPPGV